MTCVFQDKQSIKKLINNMRIQRPESKGPLLIGSIDSNPFCISKKLFSYQWPKQIYDTYKLFRATICARLYMARV